LKTAVISQPMLFPWPGFFELVATADVYVHLDDAQFSSNGFMNRVQVKHATGWSWMTIPVRKAGLDQRIMDVVGGDGPWARRSRSLLSQSLARAPHLEEALRLFDHAYRQDRIVDLLIDSIEQPGRYLEVLKGQAVRSSELDVPGKSWQRVLDIVRAVGCTRYVTAHGARNYLDHEAFERAGVTVEYITYSKTPYRQLHGEFLPYVTVLDLIATMGPEARSALRPVTTPWRTFLADAPAPTA
jgi:WbqC-like protein